MRPKAMKSDQGDRQHRQNDQRQTQIAEGENDQRAGQQDEGLQRQQQP